MRADLYLYSFTSIIYDSLAPEVRQQVHPKHTYRPHNQRPRRAERVPNLLQDFHFAWWLLLGFRSGSSVSRQPHYQPCHWTRPSRDSHPSLTHQSRDRISGMNERGQALVRTLLYFDSVRRRMENVGLLLAVALCGLP